MAHEDTEAAEEGGPFPGANFDCFKRTYQAQLKEEDEVKPHSVPQNQVDYERDPVRMLHVDEHTSGSTTFDSFYPGPMCFEEVMAAKVGPMCFEEVMAAKVVDNANLAGEHRGGEISYPCDLDDPQPRPPTFRLHIRKAHVAPPDAHHPRYGPHEPG